MALARKVLGKDIGQWFGPSTAAGAIECVNDVLFCPLTLTCPQITGSQFPGGIARYFYCHRWPDIPDMYNRPHNHHLAHLVLENT